MKRRYILRNETRGYDGYGYEKLVNAQRELKKSEPKGEWKIWDKVAKVFIES